jgi:hypothetical protein
MNAGETLIELLEHTDAASLLVLLESQNLLVLLRREGWSDAQIKTALKDEKRSPGELLLGLFAKNRKAEELLAILGPKAVAQVEAERLKKSKSPSSLRDTSRSPRTIGFFARRKEAIVMVVGGLLLAVPTAWLLFVRLDVLHVPGLIRYFPRAYLLAGLFLLGGLFSLTFGLLRLILNAKSR